MLLLIVLLSLMEFMLASQQQQGQRKSFVEVGHYSCEGKDAGNYTSVITFTSDSNCVTDPNNGVDDPTYYLIACSPNGEKTVNTLQVLAYSIYPDGAYYQLVALYLITSGNLEGKYAYLKESGLLIDYTKRCSSILGLSYTSSLSRVLLIAEQLDMKTFLNPGGSFEPFKKNASTVCQGQAYSN